jgi:uncharacterized membrane protein
MDNASKIILGLILLTYAFIGITHSNHQGFWHDEIYTLTFLKGISVYNFEGSVWSETYGTFDVEYCKSVLNRDEFFSNFRTQILHEGHPPLYFIFLKLWSYCFGTTEVALRSFSLFCGLLSFLVLFNIFRKQTKKKYVVWAAFIMLITNPFLFYFFTEARMYALAFFFASLSLKFWLEYREERNIKSYRFLYFSLSSIALLYTHYYGLFFLSSLAIFEIIKYGMKKSIFNHAIAVLLFVPWGLAIKAQLGFHNVHWTDGSVSFIDSISGFFTSIVNLLISPMGKPFIYETTLVSFFILLSGVFLFKKNRKFLLSILGVLVAYFTQVFLFDQVIDHHSILVPRYYIFLLLFLYLFFIKSMETIPKVPMVSFVAIYCLVASFTIGQIYNLERAPKQMFRELAGFMDHEFESNSRTIVFEPKGPLPWGVAYYLHNNFSMIAAEDLNTDLGNSAVYVDEMLGVTFIESKYHHKEQEKFDLIPFVGVFLYK